MNTEQANKLPLALVLEKMNAEFAEQDAHGSLWFKSPFRKESTASFHITQKYNSKLGMIWVWSDLGEGEGGTVIDLIMKRYNVDVPGALRVIEQDLKLGKSHLPPAPAPLLDRLEAREPQPNQQEPHASLAEHDQGKNNADTATENVLVKPLENRALKGYLYERGIDFWLAKPYVQEIHYTRNDKPFFALAFKNDLGDYELRNKYYKGVHGRKTITTLHRDKAQDGGTVLVFEGFIDFLSYLAWHGAKPSAPVIVLNSVEMKQEAVKAIRELGVKTIEAYPDNDEAGQKLMAYLHENLSGVQIEDRSGLYADQGYKDFNELLQAEKAKEKKRGVGR